MSFITVKIAEYLPGQVNPQYYETIGVVIGKKGSSYSAVCAQEPLLYRNKETGEFYDNSCVVKEVLLNGKPIKARASELGRLENKTPGSTYEAAVVHWLITIENADKLGLAVMPMMNKEYKYNGGTKQFQIENGQIVTANISDHSAVVLKDNKLIGFGVPEYDVMLYTVFEQCASQQDQ